MKKLVTTVLALSLLTFGVVSAQDENDDYLEFNDRNNIVHGVYLGLTTEFGEIDGKNAYLGGLKIAYVANQQFEVGFVGKFFYSEQDVFNNNLSRTEDLIGVYGGLHIEPILFSKSRINLSFPLLVGAGAVGYIDNDFDDDFDEEITEDDLDGFVVVEPGVSLLFNVNRFLQFETGVKYRFSSKIDLVPGNLNNINGFSAGIGVKVGIFNMGRNRYKKNI